MPRWQKFALLIIVCAGHFGALLGVNFQSHGQPGLTSTTTSERPLAVFTVSAPALDTAPHTGVTDNSRPSAKASRAATENPVSAIPPVAAEVPSVAPAPDVSASLAGIKFFSADEVDKTADVSDNFDSALEQILPANVESIMLEFWISRDGTTLRVLCTAGACSEAVITSLNKLSELKFSPAIKDDEAVASRKVIQVDTKPMFGL